ncbi:PAS domain S-box protein [Hyalangium rubrum]|uniref:histidine kinase n=1 Tax=Hyalangium rubrum TaxID=3103134 RepID=A0ABU5HCN0_9BACT|nr:PAS domain S-box protein [Hyalangium sp. s54d21]MDY7231213.1 PAS domain S-box protein [Hyalangium sp. s54d21]
MNDTPLPAPRLSRLGEELFDVRHHALIRAILDNISEGVSIADASGEFVYVSPFAIKLFGVGLDHGAKPEEWSSRFGIFRADEVTLFPVEEMPIWRALKGVEVRDVEMFIRNPEVPQGLHIRTSCFPIRDAQGQLLGAMAVSRDVDKQWRMEDERRRSKQNFRLLVETAQEGVWTIDEEARTTYVNRYMADLFGYSSEEMYGKTCLHFMTEESRRVATESLQRRVRGQPEVLDLEFIRKDGSHIWTSMSTSSFFDEQGRYVGALAMVTDITRRRAAEEQVRQLNSELERRIAERTEQLEYSNRELEAFAYTVAHDLRAPLRSITGFSDALVEEFGERLEEVGRGHLKRVVSAAKHMSELIDGILALSRVNSTELVARSCELSTMARAIIEQLQAEQPERKVRVSIQEGLADRGDPRLLRAVLENLLANAWKFTRGREVAEIEFRATQDARGVRTYVVSDNGAGFDMAYRDKLFGVFKRLHSQKEFEGTGVGLATVQRIIRRHGGRVWGEGERGQGARFFFTLGEHPLSSQKV